MEEWKFSHPSPIHRFWPVGIFDHGVLIGEVDHDVEKGIQNYIKAIAIIRAIPDDDDSAIVMLRDEVLKCVNKSTETERDQSSSG